MYLIKDCDPKYTKNSVFKLVKKWAKDMTPHQRKYSYGK